MFLIGSPKSGTCGSAKEASRKRRPRVAARTGPDIAAISKYPAQALPGMNANHEANQWVAASARLTNPKNMIARVDSFCRLS